MRRQKVTQLASLAPRNNVVAPLLKLDPGVEFGHRNNHTPDKSDRLPQEFSYLWAFANGGSPRECVPNSAQKHLVWLLSSDTNDAECCALILRDVLNSNGNNRWTQWYEARTEVEVAKGVNAKDGGAFATQGIHNWMGAIHDMAKELIADGYQRIFLNVTGGYKGTVPYSTLMGMLRRTKVSVTIAYLFEQSTEIIYMPSYPVGLDFQPWHENALRLRMSRELRKRGGFNCYSLDEPVENLLDGEKLSPYGQELETQYKDQLTKDRLQVYSRHIIERLLHEDGPWVGGRQLEGAATAHDRWGKNYVAALRDILTGVVDKVGDIIWLGDKIPEMVEHAQRHHHDLLEFAELFLTPILHVNPDFLNAQERFVLLSAVLLHDCGHSLDRLSVPACGELERLFESVVLTGIGDEIPLFPTDIRDYHQYLAGIRLNDSSMAEELAWPGCNGLKEKDLAPSLHDAVLLACLYHRRRMDYDTDRPKLSKKAKLHLTGQWPGRLENQRVGCDVNLMKVVALLRLIDGCDSQQRRAGPRERIDLSISLLDEDYRTASMRARQAYDALTTFRCCPAEWKEAISQEERDGSGGVTSPWRLNDPHRKIRIAGLAMLNGTECGRKAKQLARLWLMAAEAADRATIRFDQFPHYLKHRVVERIDVLPSSAAHIDGEFSSDNLAFMVILFPDKSGARIKDARDPTRRLSPEEWLKREIVIDNEERCLREHIEEEVCSEYGQIMEYASREFRLKATYYWSGDDGSLTQFFPKPWATTNG